MEKSLQNKVTAVLDWANHNRQPQVGEVVKELANLVEDLEAQLATEGKDPIKTGVSALSYSELQAMKEIMAAFDGDETLLVASKIADQVGITRSVIVNGLRKLESAGVIESRSLGMKGTRIKLLLPGIRQAVAAS